MESSGLRASGSANLLPKKLHWRVALPKAITPAPVSAPVIACVVDTGIPVVVATRTHPTAPASTATKKVVSSDVPVAKSPVLKLLMRPPANQKEKSAPSEVVAI